MNTTTAAPEAPDDLREFAIRGGLDLDPQLRDLYLRNQRLRSLEAVLGKNMDSTLWTICRRLPWLRARADALKSKERLDSLMEAIAEVVVDLKPEDVPALSPSHRALSCSRDLMRGIRAGELIDARLQARYGGEQAAALELRKILEDMDRFTTRAAEAPTE